MSLTLPDLIDIPDLQRLMDRFHAAIGIPVAILGSDGSILVAAGFQEICTDFHRLHPVTAGRCRGSDKYVKTRLSAGSYVQYKCDNGLWDIAAPIIIGGQHLATLFLGQFFFDDEEIDEAFFRWQAHEFGFDLDRYLAALRRLPVFTREKVRQIMDLYTSWIEFLVSTGMAQHQQREAERALRESEERYRALVEGANDAIVTIRDGRCVGFNNKALEIYRCTAGELLGATPADFAPPMQPDGTSSAAKALEKMNLAFSGTPQFFDWRHLRRDGTSFDAEVGLNRVEYQGKAELLVIVRDITERKRAEEALKVSEAEKSLILNSTMDIVLYHDPELRILWGNRGAQEAAGMPPEALVGRRCWEVWHQRTEPCHGCPVVLARNTGEPQEAEMRTPDGRVWYLRGFPVKDDQGRVKGVVEFGLDITERKRAEEALRESEDKFTRAFRATPSALVISTLAEGRYIEVNESFERTMGYLREEVIGRTSQELNIWGTPEARTRFLRIIREEGKVQDLEETFRTKSDEILVGLLSADVIEIGGEECLLILANDITERKRMEDEIRTLNADLADQAFELEAANRELEAFNYTVSHDLRSPLTVIRGYTQALLELYGCRPDDPGTDFLREISRAAEKMEDLITTLLDFSCLSRSAITREVVDLSAIAAMVAFELKVNEPQRNVMLSIAEGVEAEGDAQLLRIVLENLIGNAWKYTSRKEGAVIEFGAVEAEGTKALFVRDNGPGFDMAHADRLFRPFQRLPGASEFAGHGIGLATVQRIIHRHGGRVWAEGEPRKGATFYFTLWRGTLGAKTEPMKPITCTPSATPTPPSLTWRG